MHLVPSRRSILPSSLRVSIFWALLVALSSASAKLNMGSSMSSSQEGAARNLAASGPASEYSLVRIICGFVSFFFVCLSLTVGLSPVQPVIPDMAHNCYATGLAGQTMLVSLNIYCKP